MDLSFSTGCGLEGGEALSKKTDVWTQLTRFKYKTGGCRNVHVTCSILRSLDFQT